MITDITMFSTRVTRRKPSVEQQHLTFPEHLISPPVYVIVLVVFMLATYMSSHFLFRVVMSATISS